jgi:hypothetical protein
MRITIAGNGDKLEVGIVIVWDSVKALLKALLPVITVVTAFLAAPEVARFLDLIK